MTDKWTLQKSKAKSLQKSASADRMAAAQVRRQPAKVCVSRPKGGSPSQAAACKSLRQQTDGRQPKAGGSLQKSASADRRAAAQGRR